jgi:hypothetical protein
MHPPVKGYFFIVMAPRSYGNEPYRRHRHAFAFNIDFFENIP